jgi:uncharacterized protein YecT (DUF1311 family)
MSYLKKIASLLLTVFVITASYSQVEQVKHPLDNVYKDCCNRNHGDYGASKCANEINQEWDKEILKYYNALMNILDSNVQKNLREAEKQWMEYRNAEYKFSRDLSNMEGTMYIRIRAQKNMRIVRARALELKSYYWIKTEENEPKDYEAINLKKAQKIDSILPRPDSSFFNNPKPLAESIIEKYIKTYFKNTQPTKILERGRSEIGEPVRDCHQETIYGNISVETNSCDMMGIEQTFRFKNYAFVEIKRILKMLLKGNEHQIWNGNKYGPREEGAGDCYTELKEAEDQVIISYYCVGC